MKKIGKLISFLILLPSLLCVFLICSFDANAQEKVVRVGWFESNFNISDEFGRRSGYAYDYQQALAVYTGWDYEYVPGSWPELLEKLTNGEIDVLSDVSHTTERETEMLFSSQPMGTEDYYIYKSPSNNNISNDDFSTFNGKKIGINKNSIMVDYFNNWASQKHVNVEVVELVDSVDGALKKLNRGEIDLYANMDGSIDIDSAIPLCKFGSSNFYFAVSKEKPELKDELDRAMSKLLETNPYFHIELRSKYFKSSGVNLYLSEEEKEYIKAHGKIKVGYQDNYLAFCSKDSNGELTGALKDYLNLASDCLKNAKLEFEAIAYPTASKALEALKAGEVDCMFPANFSVYDGEKNNLFMTAPIIKTEIVAVVPESEQKNFLKNENIKVAVNKGNPNYDLFLKDNYPDWQAVYFENTEDCLKGINEGKADCLLISNYRFNNLASKCTEYKLVNLSTGVEMDYFFAVSRDDMVLYSILNKVINDIPESSVNSAISFYYTEDAKQGFGDFINKYFAIIMIVLGVIALVFLGLIFRIILVDRKSRTRQLLIKATEIEEITGLYNKTFFIEYVNKLYSSSPDKQMDVAVIYIDRFHSIKDLNGNDFAVQLLKEVSDEIKVFIKENGGIAGYSIDGRFAIYFDHLEDYQNLFDRIQGRIDMISPISNIRIRMGVMPWQKDNTPSQLIEQAILACSKAMTETKDSLVVIDEKMKMKEERNKKLLNDLGSAIDNNEFKIYYQPKYDIKSKKIIGAEALLRWNHPELGIIEPIDFIPLFEKHGEIVRVDKFVRSAVIKQLSKWKNKYGFVLPVSVNVSRSDVLEQTFEYSLNVLMEEYEVDRDSLIIEINENSLIENVNQFVTILKRLRNHGYKIELDDFGNGYLSLKLLSLVTFDVLKIDDSLLENIENNEKNELFFKIVIGLAKNLDMFVIAEGVETENQLDFLKEVGCPCAQGFYLSKPLLASEFEDLIFKKEK